MDITLHEPHIAFLLHKVAQDENYPNYKLIQDQQGEHRLALVEAFETFYVIDGMKVRSFDYKEKAQNAFDEVKASRK